MKLQGKTSPVLPLYLFKFREPTDGTSLLLQHRPKTFFSQRSTCHLISSLHHFSRVPTFSLDPRVGTRQRVNDPLSPVQWRDETGVRRVYTLPSNLIFWNFGEDGHFYYLNIQVVRSPDLSESIVPFRIWNVGRKTTSLRRYGEV